MSLGLSKVTQF